MKPPSSRRTLLVPAALFIVVMSSCTRVVYEASLEGTKRKYSGDSYSSPSTDASDFGFNLMAMYFAGMTGLTPKGNIPDKKTSMFETTEALFASTYRSGINQNGIGAEDAAGSGFKENIKLFTGIGLVMKNSKDGQFKVRTNYVEVPVYAAYLHPLDDGSHVFGGLGPYLAYGIGGKTKGPGFSEKSFDKDFGLKRFDAGLSFTAGYMLPAGFQGRIAYDLGLTDIDRIDVDKTKNRTFSLNIGVPIGRLIKSK